MFQNLRHKQIYTYRNPINKFLQLQKLINIIIQSIILSTYYIYLLLH